MLLPSFSFYQTILNFMSNFKTKLECHPKTAAPKKSINLYTLPF